LRSTDLGSNLNALPRTAPDLRRRSLSEPDVAANDNEPERPGRPAAPNQRANVAVLVAVVVIGLALYWAVSAIRQHDAFQNCIDSGRHDCVEVDDGAR